MADVRSNPSTGWEQHPLSTLKQGPGRNHAWDLARSTDRLFAKGVHAKLPPSSSFPRIGGLKVFRGGSYLPSTTDSSSTPQNQTMKQGFGCGWLSPRYAGTLVGVIHWANHLTQPVATEYASKYGDHFCIWASCTSPEILKQVVEKTQTSTTSLHAHTHNKEVLTSAASTSLQELKKY